MKLVGTGFAYPETDKILDEVRVLPNKFHTYGDPQPSLDDPLHWMSYKAENLTGQIKFLRGLNRKYPDFANAVTSFVSTIFTFNIDPSRVHLLWTSGTVRPHVDEGNRISVLNIGLRNSNSASTFVSDTTDLAEWQKTKTEVVCQDGNAYLIDTSKVHSVEALDPSADRFLVTYGFMYPIDKILSRLREPS